MLTQDPETEKNVDIAVNHGSLNCEIVEICLKARDFRNFDESRFCLEQ